MAADSTSSRPSFLKPLILHFFSTRLRLPDVFVQKHRESMSRNMKLRIGTGKTWNVRVEETDGGSGGGEWFFTAGWKEFVEDLELKEMQMLVFWLNVNEATFDVAVYAADACERELSELMKLSGDSGNGSRLRFEFVLNNGRRSRMFLFKSFVEAAGLIGKGSVVLQFPPEERYWPALLEERKQHGHTVEIGIGWNDFRFGNRMVFGRKYSLEFDPLKNVILVNNPSSSSLRPSFFKLLILRYSTILKLPDVFVRKYRNSMHENMKLRIATGRTWDVMLAQNEDDGGEWYFTVGWSDFVKDLELKEMQMLVFWLNDDESTFDVSVYATNTCEREFSDPIMGRRLLLTSGEVGASETGPRSVFVLTATKKYRMALCKGFVDECGLRGKNIVLQFPPKERYWSVVIEHRPQQYSVEMGAGWCDFRKENGLVIGNTYCFEFHRNKNVVLVKEIN